MGGQRLGACSGRASIFEPGMARVHGHKVIVWFRRQRAGHTEVSCGCSSLRQTGGVVVDGQFATYRRLASSDTGGGGIAGCACITDCNHSVRRGDAPTRQRAAHFASPSGRLPMPPLSARSFQAVPSEQLADVARLRTADATIGGRRRRHGVVHGSYWRPCHREQPVRTASGRFCARLVRVVADEHIPHAVPRRRQADAQRAAARPLARMASAGGAVERADGPVSEHGRSRGRPALLRRVRHGMFGGSHRRVPHHPHHSVRALGPAARGAPGVPGVASGCPGATSL
eukprot:ctg_748.g267